MPFTSNRPAEATLLVEHCGVAVPRSPTIIHQNLLHSSVTTFSIPSVALYGVLRQQREAPQCICLLLSQEQRHLPLQRRQALCRVCLRSDVGPVQERIHRHQLELLLAVSLIHNSSIERCRTFPDPVLTSLLPHCCRRQLSPPPSFRSVPSSVSPRS